ncbi:prolipoprotein diacylglyceryl transferase [Undibacterium sp. Di24W]|uniref:prolipoprotein diacylglyceryl transferase n=1 Tax=Undibacterium sp. Di24W TaxID=3413033 RepID=UPI003BF3B54E
MSFPYLSDVINHLFGTQWTIPIATFGSFVGLAIVIASSVGQKEVRRFEALGLLKNARTAGNNLVPAHQMVSNLTVITALFGVLGARVFHILEYPAEFLHDPMGMIFSRGGLSIYGGLIFGVIAGAIYLKRRGLPILPMLDALAPAMILGYGIGRIGCQISGDGDWGRAADLALKSDWLPHWFWAQTYDNNIAGILIPSPGVYPTPIYESITAFGIFLFLRLIKTKQLASYSMGTVFFAYLILSGFGRLLIEKIRINSTYHFLGWNFTQAELISMVLIFIGLFGLLRSSQLKRLSKLGLSIFVIGALAACTVH